MKTTSRAVLCLLLIAGFYVTALALVLGMLALAAALVSWGHGVGSKFAWVAIAAAGGLVLTLRRVGKAQKHVPHGVMLTPDEAPELWALVAELATAAQTRVPREIRLVPEVNAAVSEDARMLGLVPGTRRLYVGLPLLQALDVAQLRSVLAHELGHYSHGHTRLGPITYRGRQVVVGAASEVDGFSGWVLKGYGRLYLLASAAVSRRQEREADEVSVAVAGPAVAAEALREIEVLAAAWQFYLDRYVSDAWEAGMAPTSDAFFGGFQHLLAARGDELARLRTQAPPSEQSRWDSHPSTASRIAAIGAMHAPEVARDTRPASMLVPGADAAAARLAEELVQFGDRERLAWDELTPRARAAANQHTADLVFRASGRLAGVERGTLRTVLDVVESGRLDQLLRALDLDPQAAPDDEGVTPGMSVWAAVLRCALVASGVSRWEHRWEAGDPFVGDVTPAQVRELARLGAAGPAGAAELRARLVGLGVDLDDVGAQSEADARGAAVVAGVANVAVDGEQYDVLVLTHGLVLVPCPKQYNQGKRRLRELARSATPAEIAASHWFVSFEDVASGAVVKRFPVAVAFTLHDGTTMQLKTRLDSEELTSGSSVTLQNLAKGYSAVPA
ncbi:M48 family metallopeptidase [Cellulomonas sp. DKR-3]|uniref:M48 family metallopeptidase n=1 Tax=Cellulomonas fulva TaxID=2835530 RepID=A0ABS5TXX8_9CELL|nr:M48 family metallopeptidase [Cellulomonas fulva]MBT0993965.1 M48 family metallopeptidase [Cellulomonas fulva]